MSKAAVALVVVLAAVVAAGAVTFPHILDPGSAEANGISLKVSLGAGNAAANDWFGGQSGVTLRSSAHGLVVRGGPEQGSQLLSRLLPVDAHRRYRVVFTGSADRSHAAGVAIGNGDLTCYVAAATIPAGRVVRPVIVPFSSGNYHRVTVVIYGDADVRVDVASVRLEPLHLHSVSTPCLVPF